MELLFCLAILFVLKEQIEKILKIAFSFILIPTFGFIFSLFFKIPFFSGVALIVIANKILKEFKTRFKDLSELVISSRRRYEYGFIEKLVHILFDMNFLVFIISVGICSLKQIISPFAIMDAIEVLLLVFISAPIFRFTESCIKKYINSFN